MHFGTLIAVIFYFKEDISLMLQSLATRNSTFPREKKLFGLLVVATIPIVLVGFGVSDILEQRLFNTFSIAISNIVFAILLLLVFLNFWPIGRIISVFGSQCMLMIFLKLLLKLLKLKLN